MTSVENENGGIAAKRAITLDVKYSNDEWLIDDVTLGDYETDTAITYVNNQYGFHFTLPNSWQDYTLILGTWNGTDIASGKQTESGPMISIRHPEWTEKNLRQDIPIMIFTLSQWEAVQNETLSVSAAPIPQASLGGIPLMFFPFPPVTTSLFQKATKKWKTLLQGNRLNLRK